MTDRHLKHVNSELILVYLLPQVKLNGDDALRGRNPKGKVANLKIASNLENERYQCGEDVPTCKDPKSVDFNRAECENAKTKNKAQQEQVNVDTIHQRS